MTALAPPGGDLAVLDRRILGALQQLRAARDRAARAGNRQNLDLQLRAEEHLNTLLEYRHVARGR